MTLQVLDLFSGIGGFSLGLERAGMETMAFCEINLFCRRVLRQHWPYVPIFGDIRSLQADDLPARPDIICGGYPCQPFSVAGKQRGEKDDRHLWSEMYRIIQACRPAWVIAENVAGHVSLGLDQVLFDLEGAGYQAQPFVIPACGLNAPHRRERVWIVGYAEHHGSFAATLCGKSGEAVERTQEGQEPTVEAAGAGGRADDEALANAESQRVQGRGASGKQKPPTPVRPTLSGGSGQGSWQAHWQAEPRVGRVADGFPDRVDRIKALGNSLVPQIPETIGAAIMAVTYGDKLADRLPIRPGC